MTYENGCFSFDGILVNERDDPGPRGVAAHYRITGSVVVEIAQ